MAVFKCKMCGGTIEFEQGSSVGVCDSCGTKQTLPRLDGDKKSNLYDRANHFRRGNEFDKAMAIYEQILNEDNTDAESYWSLVLCRYGIEYVEDPTSHKRIPTVNRAQYTSVLADENYKAALKYADDAQRAIYEEEAKAIDEIQKGILEISSKEEPFDVFICYKETDASGKRTQDSVLANDLYHQLTQEGFKVFFSRITLEDKLGTAYEPYIFAALNSSKVMVAIGTKPEYFNAVWVRNEWSRYLALIKSGEKKTLIPAYRDMDPYDLPEEFSHLQAQDMSKLGFMQDLIRGIKKIAGKDEASATVKEVQVASGGNNAKALIDRSLLLIEDNDVKKADECLEQALSLDPKNPMIYVAKLLMEFGVKKVSDLPNAAKPLSESANYEKAIRFADPKLKEELTLYNKAIIDRNDETARAATYEKACALINENTEEGIKKAQAILESLGDYKDAKKIAAECPEKAETAHKEAIYAEADKLINKKYINYAANITGIESAITKLGQIKGFKDSEDKIDECKRTIEKLKESQSASKKRLKKILAITIPSLVALAALIIVLIYVIIPSVKYNDALEKIKNGKYEDGYAILTELGDYKDSEDQIKNSKYERALEHIKNEEFKEGYGLLKELGSYKDSQTQIKKSKYERALKLFEEKNYEDAQDLFEEAGDYEDAAEQFKETTYLRGLAYLEEKNYNMANSCFERILDYKDAASKTHYHEYEKKVTKEATCEEAGTVTYTCSCGSTYAEEIPATGHEKKAATCTEPQTCSRCGKTFGNALGHTTGSAKCERCGQLTFTKLEFSGTGFKEIGDINVPDGHYSIVWEGTASSSDMNKYYSTLYNKGDSRKASLFSHAYPDEPVYEQETFEGPINGGRLIVDAQSDVSWYITIEFMY